MIFKKNNLAFIGMLLLILSCNKPETKTDDKESYFLPPPTTYNYATIKDVIILAFKVYR